MRVIIYLILLPLSVLQTLGQVFAASFDCRNAKTTMEKTVCSDARLSTMDEELAKLYTATKAELKTRPKELKNLIRDQRDWLQRSPKSLPCAAKVQCLKTSYEVRIAEMRHSLNLARATRHDATGPSKDVVMKRLVQQLTKLKELFRSARNVEMFNKVTPGNKPTVCEFIWKNLARATVPEPTSYANTGQQKRNMYMRLREMAFHNQRLFFEMGNAVEDQNKYRSTFNDLWKKYGRDFSEYDRSRTDSVNLLFRETETRAGFRLPVFVVILLDLDKNDLSLDRYELSPDGLFNSDVSGYSNGAHSNEYHYDNLLDEEQSKVQGAVNYSGIMLLGNEVVFWEANKNPMTFDKNWSVSIQPIRNPLNGKTISCAIEFDSNIKE